MKQFNTLVAKAIPDSSKATALNLGHGAPLPTIQNDDQERKVLHTELRAKKAQHDSKVAKATPDSPKTTALNLGHGAPLPTIQNDDQAAKFKRG